MHRLILISSLILTLAFSLAQTVVAEYKIRIQGAITERSSSKPLAGVNVVSGGTWIATTDIDGKYTVQIAPDAEVLFYLPGYEDVKTKVNSRQIIDVEMSERVHELAEVIVIEKATNKKVGAEPTDLEIVGNYFHLKTKFRIPAKLFKANKRFILQPTLYDVSRKQYRYFRPVVIDGNLFTINNLRFNEFDVATDSLQSYIVPNKLDDTDHIYMYHDSIYINSKHLENDFRAECYLAINGIIPRKGDYLDTVIIARGTKNPLRFFEYKFAPKQLHDSTLVPKPEMKLMTEQGVSRIAFELGKSILDPKYIDNANEVAQIQDRVSSVLNNEDAVLQSLSIVGFASPEGPYEKNLDLAMRRTQTIANYIRTQLPSSIRSHVKVESDAKVETWQNFANLLHQDSLEIYSQVQSIIDKYDGAYASCEAWIYRMPEYKKLFAPKYLPRLRRVEYIIKYSIFRQLTDSEIATRYAQGDRNLSRYEYWRLLQTNNEDNDIENNALASYPNFALVANRAALKAIHRDSFDLNILQPSIQATPRDELIYNQVLMALGVREYAIADSLAQQLSIGTEDFLHAILNAHRGRYEQAYPQIASKGGLNEVLLLLCMQRNKEAEEKVKVLLQADENKRNGYMWYTAAVCANRTDNLNFAMESLRRAIELSPELEETARLDSDVMDLVDLIIF